MKCIKNKSGDIRRVKDEVADEMVNKGWVYVPKSEYKAVNGKGVIEATVVVEVKEQLYNAEGKPRRNREKKTRR